MTALKELYESLNFENVQTYLQSENVIFSPRENNIKVLEKLIQEQIKSEFDFKVPIIVFSAKTLKMIIENNLFISNAAKGTCYLHVTFLEERL